MQDFVHSTSTAGTPPDQGIPTSHHLVVSLVATPFPKRVARMDAGFYLSRLTGTLTFNWPKKRSGFHRKATCSCSKRPKGTDLTLAGPGMQFFCLQTRHACPQTAWDATHSESMSNLHGGSLVSGPSIRCVTLSMLWVMDMCKCPRTTAAGTLLKSLPKCLLASKAPACRSIHLIEILAPKSGIRLQNPIGCRMEHTL